MTKSEVIALLEANQDERGIRHWEKLADHTKNLKSFGIGLTRLRKIAKEIGRDHKLAAQLWQTNNHEAKIIGLLIDEPKKLTREQAERQVEEVSPGSLSHVFSSCDATLAKAPFVVELACEWIESEDVLRRRCGYGLLYELSKKQRNKQLTDTFFLDHIDLIREGFDREEIPERMAMAMALMGIGKRNRKLNQASVRLAKKLGPINFDEGRGKCEPFDVVKHLTSDALRKKLDG